MISLENEWIKVSFIAKGAELRSIYHKEKDLNYMWKGDPDYWAKHSPVLFPIVGALKSDTYVFEGQEYQLPRHGFARDREFIVEQLSDAALLFSLSSDEETLKIYPFTFTLRLRYTLSGTTLSCSYEVFNPGPAELLFSLGAHPAFAAPVYPDQRYEDCYLEFPDDSSLTFSKISGNYITDETGTIDLDEGKLFLHHELFYHDALVLKQLNSQMISLKNTVNDSGLHFYFNDFPYFGIWAAKDADFVCLEPWCGLADGIDHDQELLHKEGINSLPAGQTWERNWKVAIF